MKSKVNIQRLSFAGEIWMHVRDGDAACNLLFDNHYSKYHYKDGRKHTRFVGPGERIVA